MDNWSGADGLCLWEMRRGIKTALMSTKNTGGGRCSCCLVFIANCAGVPFFPVLACVCLLACLQLKVCVRLHLANLSAAPPAGISSVCLLSVFVLCCDPHSISSFLMSIVFLMVICDVMIVIILNYVYITLQI